MEQFDLLVIGGGSAGMKAARTAAKTGRKVALAEERELGGECFWAGCVPTKAMVRAAEVWHLVRRAHEFGIHVDILRADFADAMKYRARAVYAVGGGGPEDAGLGKQGIRYYHYRAQFCDTNVVQIGANTVRADRVILATGTIPFVPQIDGLIETGYITNREAVALTHLPKSLVVLGGGPIGLEFAQTFRRFGADVTVIEAGPHILGTEDAQIAELVTEYLRQEGIHLITGANAIRAERTGKGKRITLQCGDHEETANGEEILVATGRAAATGDLDLEAAGVEFHQRAVSIDPCLRTNQPHIWAAGDVNGGYLFTHVASYEGKIAAQNAFADDPQPIDLRVVPRVTFVDPEVASVGLTEAEALHAGLDAAVHSFSFEHLDRAILHNDARGIVKLITDARTGQIIGAHMVGPHASSILSEVTLAMKHRLPISAIADTIHAYPTFPEAVEAAALDVPRYVGKVEGDAE